MDCTYRVVLDQEWYYPSLSLKEGVRCFFQNLGVAEFDLVLLNEDTGEVIMQSQTLGI